MTEDEITKITKIMLTADGWCNNCQCDLIQQLTEAFPEYAGVIDGIAQKSEWYRQELQARWNDWFEVGDGRPKPNVWEIICE